MRVVGITVSFYSQIDREAQKDPRIRKPASSPLRESNTNWSDPSLLRAGTNTMTVVHAAILSVFHPTSCLQTNPRKAIASGRSWRARIDKPTLTDYPASPNDTPEQRLQPASSQGIVVDLAWAISYWDGCCPAASCSAAIAVASERKRSWKWVGFSRKAATVRVT